MSFHLPGTGPARRFGHPRPNRHSLFLPVIVAECSRLGHSVTPPCSALLPSGADSEGFQTFSS